MWKIGWFFPSSERGRATSVDEFLCKLQYVLKFVCSRASQMKVYLVQLVSIYLTVIGLYIITVASTVCRMLCGL